MRSLSVIIKCCSVGVLLSALSCAGAPPHRPAAGVIALEGELAVAGDLPDERSITLEGEDGTVWRLEGRSLEGELLRLSGHRLRVWGVLREGPERRAVMHVDRYEMLPIDGVAPAIGTIGIDGGRVVLSIRGSHDRYVLTGPLSDALRSYSGFDAWVWGTPAGARDQDGASVLDVRGYGILGPGVTSPAPSDTLRSSGSI